MAEFLISHSGTPTHTKMAQDLQVSLEANFGYDSEQVIGETNSPIILSRYNEETNGYDKVGEFPSIPSTQMLEMYIRLS